MDNSLMVVDGFDARAVSNQLQQITKFQMAVQKQFQQNMDYGVIPGTSKPTLLKPGAEKIVMLLGLKSTFEIIESTRDFDEGFFQYQIRCKLIKNIDGTDEVITEGLGSCNTRERKYVKGNAYDLDNTVLKMAKKRALVDAALMVGSLSNIFTQDIEDMDLQGNTYTDAPRYYTDNDGTISSAQAKRMFAIAKGDSDLVKSVMARYGYSGSSSEVKKTDYEKICTKIETQVKAIEDELTGIDKNVAEKTEI